MLKNFTNYVKYVIILVGVFYLIPFVQNCRREWTSDYYNKNIFRLDLVSKTCNKKSALLFDYESKDYKIFKHTFNETSYIMNYINNIKITKNIYFNKSINLEHFCVGKISIKPNKE